MEAKDITHPEDAKAIKAVRMIRRVKEHC